MKTIVKIILAGLVIGFIFLFYKFLEIKNVANIYRGGYNIEKNKNIRASETIELQEKEIDSLKRIVLKLKNECK